MSPEYQKTVPLEITCATTRRNLQECVYCPQQNAKKRCSLKQKQQVMGKKGTEQFIYLRRDG